MVGSKEGRAKLLPRTPSERTRGNGHIPEIQAIQHCTVRVIEHCNRLSRPAEESQFLEILKTWLDRVQSNLLWMTLLWARWLNQAVSKGLFQHQLFCDSVEDVSSVTWLLFLPARHCQSNSSKQSATNTLVSSPLHSLLLAETGRIRSADCPLAQHRKYERKSLRKIEPSEAGL